MFIHKLAIVQILYVYASFFFVKFVMDDDMERFSFNKNNISQTVASH